MEAVIFDIDGTLIESANVDDELYRQSVIDVLGPIRFRPSLSEYGRVTDSGVLMEVLEDNSLSGMPDPTEEIRGRFVELLEDHIAQHGPFSEIPGAKDYIEAHRRSERHAVAIATGGWRMSALLKLESAGFDIDGVPLTTSDDHLDRTGIMTLALEQLGRGVESVTYYGDGVWDRDASAALGWRFVPIGPTLNGLTSFTLPNLR
ncbi:MAG: HAD family hydrolase [Woeseiaceae bacterium]|nr:HAD family hydrolase [Woeseiaceae bacterium]